MKRKAGESVLQQAVGECESALEKIVTGRAHVEADVKEGLKVEIAKDSSGEFGNLSFACFHLASIEKKNPAEIANAVAEEFNKSPPSLVERAQAVNGFVNFFLNERFYARVLEEGIGKNYGESSEGKGKKVLVEFSSPNVGKSMHVGHIRSTILGDAIASLYETQGWNALRLNFYSDAGAQVAKLILALRKFDMGKVENEKDLLGYYLRINKEIESNPELNEQARNIAEEMEKGDSSVLRELRKLRELSIPPFMKNYAMLGVKFDEEWFDTDAVPEALKAVDEAIAKKIAFKDKDGETVAELEPILPNIIILRSNGTTLYSTRDLGSAEMRWKKFNFDESVYVTASDQNTHFRQVFKILELLGKPYAPRLKHVGFGLISIEGGKLSTREGRVIFLEDVLNQAIAYAREEIESVSEKQSIADKKKGMTEKEIASAAQIVGIGSAKFAILRITPEKNILFDLKKIVSFEGDTGAYVQYTCVRAKSILEKAGAARLALEKETTFNAEEKKVAMLLSQYPLVLQNACRAMQPHQVCDYLLKLSAEFNEFYHKHRVLNAESEGEKEKRLLLVKASANVLEKGLALLGIKVPEKM